MIKKFRNAIINGATVGIILASGINVYPATINEGETSTLILSTEEKKNQNNALQEGVEYAIMNSTNKDIEQMKVSEYGGENIVGYRLKNIGTIKSDSINISTPNASLGNVEGDTSKVVGMEDEINGYWEEIFAGKVASDVINKPQDIIDASNKKTENTRVEAYAKGSDHRAGRKFSSGDPVYLKSNFLEMRKEMESLFGSVATPTDGIGTLYMVDNFGNIQAFNNPSYRRAMINSLNFDMKPYTAQLKEIASKSFSDITGKEWYASHIPAAVYYGLVNGLPDGTFAGSKSVTRAEFGIMIENYENKKGEFNPQKYPQFVDKWYNSCIGKLDKGLINLYNIDEAHVNKGMTRGEIAYYLADTYFVSDYSKALEKVNSGSYSNPFKDIKSAKGSVTEKAYAQDVTNGNELIKYYNEHCKDGSVVPKDVMAALLVMNDLNIIKGDDQGRSNWNKPVSRAEAVVIFNNVSQIH